MQERTIWEGHPNHLINLPVFTICGFFIGVFVMVGFYLGLLIPLCYGLYVWYENKCFNYELTTERLLLSTGVFGRNTEELELYRIKDLSVEEPFVLRLMGLANIKLTTSDKTLPEIRIRAVNDARELKDKIRKQVELLRDTKGVREIDGI